MTHRLFSIVIPAYNRKDFLVDTIKSVLQQDYTHLEVIVVDDGSTDGTYEHLQSLYKDESKVAVYSKENGERGAARNFGFKKASGEFVVFLDSDDSLMSNHLSVLNEAINRQPDYNFYATKFNFIRNGNTSDHQILATLKEGTYDYQLFLTGNHLACNFCVRRNNPHLKLFEEDRGYAIMEDWMFLMENLFSDQLYLIDEITLSMNDHDDRSMRSGHETIIQRRLKATDWLGNRLAMNHEDLNALKVNSYHFAAIHYNIDKKYNRSNEMLKKAIALGGTRLVYLKLRIKNLFRI